MERRRFLVLGASAAVAGAVGALGGCARPRTGTGPVTVTLLEYQEKRAAAVAPLLPGFEQASEVAGRPVRVELVTDVLTDEQAKTKLTQQYYAGTAPDVVDMGNGLVTGYAGAGYLLALDPWLESWPAWASYYPGLKRQIRQQDGRTYSLPHEASVQSLFYRRDVLADLGVDTAQPATWDELLGRLRAVTARTGRASIVIPAGTAWGGGTWAEGFAPLVAGTGSPVYDVASGRWVPRSPGVAATFDLYARLVREGLLPVQDLLNPDPWEPTKYEAFVEGSLPVAAQGTWGWRYDWGPEGSAPLPGLEDKVAIWDYPALVPGTRPYSVSGVNFSYVVGARTPHADAAVALAQYLASGTPMAEQLVASGAAAPRADLSGVAPYAGQPTLLDAERRLDAGVGLPTGDGSDQIAQAAALATATILDGADGPRAAAEFARTAAELLGPGGVAA